MDHSNYMYRTNYVFSVMKIRKFMKTLLCTHNYNLYNGTIDKLLSIAVKSSSTLMGSQVQIQTRLLGFDGTKTPDSVGYKLR